MPAPSPEESHTYRMPPARLSVTPDISHGPLDGAWWPRCNVLEIELPALAAVLDPRYGTVTRVTVGDADWPEAPGTVMAPGHEIEVVRSGTAAGAHTVTLVSETMGRWEFLVIPPDEPAGTAARLLAAAADPWNPLTPEAMLALADADLVEEIEREARRGHRQGQWHPDRPEAR
ncbi:DUF5994 family protein [Streptomyces coeruleoprunus]|uniref:DUF5994 family protein n=1 Tax=Streptomyces coeruleoprunus TaxID=285563 RepID=A0ABV9XCJ4_9ACTN